jgi:hypothetical protein
MRNALILAVVIFAAPAAALDVQPDGGPIFRPQAGPPPPPPVPLPPPGYPIATEGPGGWGGPARSPEPPDYPIATGGLRWPPVQSPAPQP